MAKDKKVSFRLTTEQYYSLYSIYEKYQLSCINLTFSDFLRNLLLSIACQVENENKAKTEQHII